MYNIHTCEVCFPVLQKTSVLSFYFFDKKTTVGPPTFLMDSFQFDFVTVQQLEKKLFEDNFVIQYSRLFNVKKKLSCTQLVQPVFRYLLNVTPVVDIRQLSRQVVSVGTLKIKHRAGHCAKFLGYRQQQRDNVQ